MEEKKKISEIERIKLQLEQKLLEIEKRKDANSKKKINPTKKEEKTLFELRKELQELQKNNTEKTKEIIEQKSATNSSASSKTVTNKKVEENISEIKKVTKPTIISKTDDIHNDITTNETKIVTKFNVPKKVAKKKGTTIIKKEKLAKSPNLTSKDVTKKSLSLQKTKESTISRNTIIFIIAFTFALLYLGYLYKLKVDLNKEKEVLEKKKQEQIDYSKEDAIFKEVEEEPAPEDLQDIK